jgi:hypothetical protein
VGDQLEQLRGEEDQIDRQHDDGAGGQGPPDPGALAGELGAPVLGCPRCGIEASLAAVRTDQVNPLHAVSVRGDLDAVRAEREPDRHVGGLHVPVVPVERGPALQVIDVDSGRRAVGEFGREAPALQGEGAAERLQRRSRLRSGRRPGSLEAFKVFKAVDPVVAGIFPRLLAPGVAPIAHVRPFPGSQRRITAARLI